MEYKIVNKRLSCYEYDLSWWLGTKQVLKGYVDHVTSVIAITDLYSYDKK